MAAHPVGVHDVGGRDAGTVDRHEHDLALWERRVDAMVMVLSRKQQLTVDELRRNVEQLGPGAYEAMGYYERWVAALTNAMIERGHVTATALGRRMVEVGRADRGPGMSFSVGDDVVVRDAWQPGHVRTPTYVRGHAGVVAQVLGAYPNPEEIAYRRSGQPAPILYRIRFAQADLWRGYAGAAADTLDVEIYEHWLEPAETRA